MKNKVIGSIIGGSLTEGLLMRVTQGIGLDTIKTGNFVCIQSEQLQFFSLVTDITLEVADQEIIQYPPQEHERLLHQIVATQRMYALVRLRPMLALNNYGNHAPVKSIPPHFAPVLQASKEDISRIFGKEQEGKSSYFSIGNPLDMDAEVCIDLERFGERSNGIFGKTGTGKTFLTRLMLAGLIKNKKSVCLIFDMHNEYGVQARKEGGPFVKGLKSLFPSDIVICSLDPQSSRRRGGNPDLILKIPYSSIQVEDVIALQDELNLNPTAYESAYLLAAKYKSQWLSTLLSRSDQLKELAQEVGANVESLAALHRKLKGLERFNFISDTATEDVVARMIEYLDKGKSIILEFGNYTSTLCYLLIANIITRALHKAYTQKTEHFLATQAAGDEPKKLMIVVEEAHKFLNPHAARQTIFGTIAREMRKYYVSLLVVDQRPSGIDAEVLSQIGTKIVAQLNDDKDIQAVLTGVSGAQQLRTVLAGLDSKKQVLIMGHAVPMPIVIESRSYDETFYSAMQQIAYKPVEEILDQLF